jgi:hypothetical protein
MSPTSHCYLDYHQTASGETAPIGPLLPLEKVYAYEPVPPELTPEQAKHVRGVQGNLWTEFVPNFAHAGCMQYPRLSAIAEIGWSKPGPRDFDDFQRRVAQNELRLDALGMTYRPLPPAGIEQAIRAGDGGRFTIAMPAEGLTRHYTTDGSDPTQQSARYEQPVELPTAGLATVRARFFRPGTRIGYYDEQTFVNGLPLTVETTLRQHDGHAMTRAFDGKLETFFWHNRAVRKDDHLTLRFSEPRAMRSIVVKTGKPDGSGDRLADGALEVSRGGGAFAAVAEFRDGAADAALDGAPIDAVRIRARAASTQWLVIREITLR